MFLIFLICLHTHPLFLSFSMADEYLPTSKEDALLYFRHNFNRHFQTNRAPFNIYLHGVWLLNNAHVLEALKEFMDELLQRPEVYFVTQMQAIEWMKRPQTLANIGALDAWKCNTHIPGPETCSNSEANACVYTDPVTGNPITMTTCAECPPEFPWLGNTDGRVL
eukprot:m.39090 g.39090  ORF g.39090 m.39090 type:complete len:165 (+) comp10263_c0_seq1:25-519(+)